MAEISIRPPGEDDFKGEDGERGHRGHRGHAGHAGATGATGPAGATGPVGAPGSTGPTGAPGSTAALLPMSIHGSAFQASAHIEGTGVELQFGFQGAFIPEGSGTVSLFASVSLPAGTRISTVTVRVTDTEGTPVEVSFGAEDGSQSRVSALSRGDGTSQSLVIDVGGEALEPDKAYFIGAINPAGNLGWSLHGATIA